MGAAETEGAPAALNLPRVSHYSPTGGSSFYVFFGLACSLPFLLAYRRWYERGLALGLGIGAGLLLTLMQYLARRNGTVSLGEDGIVVEKRFVPWGRVTEVSVEERKQKGTRRNPETTYRSVFVLKISSSDPERTLETLEFEVDDGSTFARDVAKRRKRTKRRLEKRDEPVQSQGYRDAERSVKATARIALLGDEPIELRRSMLSALTPVDAEEVRLACVDPALRS